MNRNVQRVFNKKKTVEFLLVDQCMFGTCFYSGLLKRRFFYSKKDLV